VATARQIVEQLLEEAILAPYAQWDLRHLMKQYKIKLLRIPDNVRADHAKDVLENIVAFSKNTRPITVGDDKWWMPFPYGWRLGGTGQRVKTVMEPSETIATERVENPFLPEVHRSWWRDKY
jgi:hypothetical protein